MHRCGRFVCFERLFFLVPAYPLSWSSSLSRRRRRRRRKAFSLASALRSVVIRDSYSVLVASQCFSCYCSCCLSACSSCGLYGLDVLSLLPFTAFMYLVTVWYLLPSPWVLLNLLPPSLLYLLLSLLVLLTLLLSINSLLFVSTASTYGIFSRGARPSRSMAVFCFRPPPAMVIRLRPRTRVQPPPPPCFPRQQ